MLPRSAAFFLFAIGPLAALAAMSACGSNDESTVAPINSSVDDGATVTEGICPTAAPVAGDTCLLPEGTTCAFGACGTPIARCLRGVWQFGGVPSPPPCPDSPPASESACPACWPTTETCRYGSNDCSQPDATANRTLASCSSGTWTLVFEPCADASTDVQGDGGPDRD